MSEHDPEELRAAAATIAAAVRAVSADGDWSIELPDPEPGELVVERLDRDLEARPTDQGDGRLAAQRA